jgi:hypothetical protein
MKGDFVYSSNGEDFKFREPEDCLDDCWNNCFDDYPSKIAIYQATDTGVNAYDCEEDDEGAMTEVVDFVQLKYQRTNADVENPEWALIGSIESASDHVWREPS